MEKEFDVIVFGASGFTGELVVEEMAKSALQENLRWAVAGRNRQKVQQILVEVQKRLNTDHDLKSIKIFEADVNDWVSLETMCRNTRLLLNCVGPYIKYGEPVVEACLKCKTHAIDMSVEISYLNHIMLTYHQEAESREVYIISSCGIGYTFFEMAVQILQQKYKDRIERIDIFIKPSFKFRSVHFATWDSIINSSNGYNNLLSTRQKIYSQNMNKAKSKCSILALAFPMKVSIEAKGLGFIFPSVLHPLQLSVDMKEEVFKEKPVKVNMYWTLHSLTSAMVYITVGFFLIVLFPFWAGRWLLTKYAGFFSCGLVKNSTLTEETKDIATLMCTAVATLSSEESPQVLNICRNGNTTAVLHGSSPPSYKTSAICLVNAALTVLQEIDHLPNRGGIYTPLAAFARTSLPSRLQKNGITFKEKKRGDNSDTVVTDPDVRPLREC